MSTDPLPAGLGETPFQATVIDYAKLRGWFVCHQRPARTATGWRTAVQGHEGFPDLVLARNGVVILAELKGARGHPTPQQAAWGVHIGEQYRLWRPMDWPQIVDQLR
jgi:hypothetical protein